MDGGPRAADARTDSTPSRKDNTDDRRTQYRFLHIDFSYYAYYYSSSIIRE